MISVIIRHMGKNKENKKSYVLPDHAKEAQRTATQAEYGLFALNDEAEKIGRGKKYYIHSYGCQANVRDGETIAGMMEIMGFQNAMRPEDADVLIFNSCAVRRAAEEHLLGNVGALKYLKKENPDKIFCICGCMAQEETVVQEILKSYPEVDLVFGTHNIYRLPDLLLDVMKKKEKKVEVYSDEGEVIENLPVRRSSSCKGFIDIMYGCNKFCTYCIVPYTRGKERSRHPEAILSEVRQFQEQGGREVMLLGQNVNAYGKDLGMKDGFTDLLIQIADTGIERIRYYSPSPRDFSETTIQAILDHPNIMPAMHLPVQSGSDEVLRRMARGYTVDQYLEIFDHLKERIPDLAITTDIIVGFPGETEEDFQKTLNLVDYCKYDMAYSFMYSPREGTPAAKMPDQIPTDVKKQRLMTLNAHLDKWAHAKNQNYIGKTVEVLCEGVSRKNPDAFSGYSRDGKLVNFTGKNVHEGQLVQVEITKAQTYTLDGKAVEKEA